MGKTLTNRKISFILFATVWTTYCLVAMTRNAAAAAITAIVAEGAMTKSQAGLITAMFYLVYGILQIPGGMLADKYKPDRLVLIGIIGAGIANLVICFCPTYPVIMGAWIFNALTQFALWPSIFRIISSEIAKVHRKTAILWISLATSAGTFLSYIVAIVVKRWQDNFTFAAVVMFISAIIFDRIHKYTEKYMVPETEEIEETETKRIHLPKWQIFLCSGLLFMMPVNLIREVVNSGLRSFAPIMFMESYETVSPALGNSFNLIIVMSGVAGILLVKYLLYPRFIKGELTGALLIMSVALPASLLTLFIGKTTIAIIVVLMSVIYAVTNAVFMLINMWIQKFDKYGCEGTVAGVINAFAAIGIVVASYGFGALAEITGNWYSTVWVWIILVAISVVLIAAAAVMWRRFNKVNETKGENGNAQKL